MTTSTPTSRHYWIKSPSSPILKIKTLPNTTKPALNPLILTPTSNNPLLYDHQHSTYHSLTVAILWTCSFRHINIFHSIKFRWTSVCTWWDFTCREMLSPGLNGCTTIAYSRIDIPSQGP